MIDVDPQRAARAINPLQHPERGIELFFLYDGWRKTRTAPMQNVTLKVEGTKLLITVDLAHEIGPSKSGKTILIASTEGNANVPGQEGVKLGLNVYRAKR